MKTKINEDYNIVFIDLDNTLIETYSGDTFPRCIADMKLIWKTWNTLRDWAKNRKDWKVFIITNQNGIQRGYVNEESWKIKIMYICQALWEYLGKSGKVDYIYSISKSSPMYKPGIGMFEYFWKPKYNKSDAVMIGDAAGKDGDFSDSDLKAAKNFGIDFIDVDDL